MTPSGLPLFDMPRSAPVGGATFDATKDGSRLSTCLRCVADVMRDGEWRTLAQIREAVTTCGIGASEAGISARLRDLRKPWAGSHVVEGRRIGGTGTWQYRVVSSRTAS